MYCGATNFYLTQKANNRLIGHFILSLRVYIFKDHVTMYLELNPLTEYLGTPHMNRASAAAYRGIHLEVQVRHLNTSRSHNPEVS